MRRFFGCVRKKLREKNFWRKKIERERGKKRGEGEVKNTTARPGKNARRLLLRVFLLSIPPSLQLAFNATLVWRKTESSKCPRRVSCGLSPTNLHQDKQGRVPRSTAVYAIQFQIRTLQQILTQKGIKNSFLG
jgi:hypothetical protein